jgi:hypothetical protein
MLHPVYQNQEFLMVVLPIVRPSTAQNHTYTYMTHSALNSETNPDVLYLYVFECREPEKGREVNLTSTFEGYDR